MRILLGITGSVAAVKAPKLAMLLTTLGETQAVATPAAKHFLDRADNAWPSAVPLLTEQDEWLAWNQRQDPVLHIELRKWADVLVVAPASADFLAKVSGGLADNLLLSICRAWDFTKPILLAPAMNTMMWSHPVTQEHLARLARWGVVIVPPIEKTLACGDIGLGGLAEVTELVDHVRQTLQPNRELAE